MCRPCIALTCALLFMSTQLAQGNSGVQLRLDQYQAGTESTDASLIVNPGFETVDGSGYPTGWQNNSPVMRAAAPDPANLPSPASVLGTRAAQAFNAAGVDPFLDYKFFQTVTLTQNTDYVLSAYIWSYGVSGPPPVNDLFAGDLAVVELVQTDNIFNSTGLSLEPTALDNAPGARGYFVYKSFNSSQFPNGVAQLEVEFDPNQDLNFGQNRPPLSAQFDNIAITPLAAFASQRFTATTGGAWSNPGNWINGPANAKGAIAGFHTSTPGGTNAFVGLGGANQTVAAVNFAAGNYVIQGPGTLTLDHQEFRDAVILNNLTGSNQIQAPIAIGAGTTNLGGVILVPRQFKIHVAAGVLTLGEISMLNYGTLGSATIDLTKTGPGSARPNYLRARSVAINAGDIRINPNGTPAGTSRVGSLTIAGTPTTPLAALSLTNNAMVIDYTGTSPLNNIVQLIKAAFGSGSFTGNGIRPDYLPGYGIGYAEASALPAVPAIFGSPDSTSVLLRGTLNGDANMDGAVNLSDFSLLGSGFNLTGEWTSGDFNYDGLVNIGDFSMLASNFNSVVSGDAANRGVVPEPASSVALLLTAVAAARRRH